MTDVLVRRHPKPESIISGKTQKWIYTNELDAEDWSVNNATITDDISTSIIKGSLDEKGNGYGWYYNSDGILNLYPVLLNVISENHILSIDIATKKVTFASQAYITDDNGEVLPIGAGVTQEDIDGILTQVKSLTDFDYSTKVANGIVTIKKDLLNADKLKLIITGTTTDNVTNNAVFDIDLATTLWSLKVKDITLLSGDKDAINANSKKIIGVTAGTDDTDAVNKKQLTDTLQEAKDYTETKAGTSNTLTSDTTLQANADITTFTLTGTQLTYKSNSTQFKFNIYFKNVTTPWTDHGTYQDANNYDRLTSFGSTSWIYYLNNAGVKTINFKQKPQIDIASYTPSDTKDLITKGYLDIQLTSVQSQIPTSNQILTTINQQITTQTSGLASVSVVDSKDASILSQANNYTDTKISTGGGSTTALSNAVTVASNGTYPNASSAFTFGGQNFNKNYNFVGTADITIRERTIIGSRNFIESFYVADTSNPNSVHSYSPLGISGSAPYVWGLNSLGSYFFTFNVIPSCSVAPIATSHLANKDYVDKSMPIGSRILWGTSNFMPQGYLECNGMSYNTTTYATLFTLLGTSTTPNLSSSAPAGHRYIIRAI
jgi:microcystin-dependent protein